jgi:thioredoxin-related protein
MKYILICLSIPFMISSHKGGHELDLSEEIEWMSWEQAIKANELDKKKFLVDVYTEWCTWCKVMDRETFSDSAVSNYVREHFYAIKLNAEQKESIIWNGKEFKWMPSGLNGVHELAYALCDGQMSYPCMVFMTENHERIRISKGFKDPRTFYSELRYAAEEHYLKNRDKP